MGIDTSLAIANSGLAAIDRQFALISQNVANAGTPGYATETAALSSSTAGGFGDGVIGGPATRILNSAVQAQVFGNSSNVAYQTTTATALSAIDQVMGTPGQSNDLGSLTGAVQSAFSTLLTDPSNPVQQNAAVNAAQNLTGQINTIANTISTVRQSAQSNISSGIAALNTNLAQIGTLNKQIVALKQQGLSTADLENQRDTALGSVANLTGAKFISQPNGAIGVFTQSGLQLPTDGTSKLSVQNGTTGPNAYYPGGGLAGITLSGQDVTASFSSGSIGASVALRDVALPQLQAGLDSFSQNLAGRFSAQGLTLFSDPSGNIPSPVNATGFANAVTVNPGVSANPALVRDGTQAVAGSPGGASTFTPNPSGGPAGFSDLIQRIVTYALGANVQPGVGQPAPASAGLGPAGNLSLGYSTGGTLGAVATSFTAAEANTSNSAQAAQTSAQSLQTSLQTQFSSSSSVSIDQQMGTLVSLQNAYAANAKVVSIANQMWQTVQAMIQ